MNKLVVAVFSDERAANNGVRKLKDLRKKDGTLFESFAVVARSADGKLALRDNVHGASAATAGALIGALAGFSAGGPPGAAFAATAGALFGLSADLINRGADTQFVKKVARELSPGKIAIVAEVPEGRIEDFRTQMETADGMVIQCGQFSE